MVSKAPPVTQVSIFFRSFRQPTGVRGLPGASNRTTFTRYEADVLVTGVVQGSFRGSVYPDDMDVKGHLPGGTYPVFLGFHKAGTPSDKDLEVRTNGFRPVLVVNGGNRLPVVSNSGSKTHADGIHIHNGYPHWHAHHPMSEGCLLIHPGDWSRFITLFLDAYPKLSDWSAHGSRVGARVGTVTVHCSPPVGDFPMPRRWTALA